MAIPPRRGDVLGWEARTTFDDLVRLMLEHDLTDAGIDRRVVGGV